MKITKNIYVFIFIFIFILILFLIGFKLNLIESTSSENNLQRITDYNEKNIVLENEKMIKKKKVSEGKDIKEEIVDSFVFEPLSKEVIHKIEGVSWKKEAPVKLEDLSYVRVLYWGFDEKEHVGELIVHKKIAQEITDIFKELYNAKFPIEKIKLIDEYEANDDLSMADNNTSSFCFRGITGGKGTLSKHSYGIAIDINPIQNPYIKGEKISPKAGRQYIDRGNIRKGMIVKDSICYKTFKEKGWIWGGEWKSLKDYQHFQKNIDLNEE